MTSATPIAVPVVPDPNQSVSDLASACRRSAHKLKAVLPPRPTIAVIEDDFALTKLWVKVLEPLAEVKVIQKPQDIVALLKKQQIDLVFTDHYGLGMVDQIKKVAPDLQVVVVSGDPAPSPLPEGVALWRTKPITNAELYAIAERELDIFGLTLAE